MCVLLHPNKIEVRTLFHLTVNTTLKVYSTGHHCSRGGYSKLHAAATVNSCCRDSTYGALAQKTEYPKRSWRTSRSNLWCKVCQLYIKAARSSLKYLRRSADEDKISFPTAIQYFYFHREHVQYRVLRGHWCHVADYFGRCMLLVLPALHEN